MGLRSSLTLTVPHLFLNTGRSVRLGGQILSPGSRARTRRRPPQAPSPARCSCPWARPLCSQAGWFAVRVSGETEKERGFARQGAQGKQGFAERQVEELRAWFCSGLSLCACGALTSGVGLGLACPGWFKNAFSKPGNGQGQRLWCLTADLRCVGSVFRNTCARTSGVLRFCLC